MKWPWSKSHAGAQLVDQCAASYWRRLLAGRRHEEALRGMLEDQFAGDQVRADELWKRFRSKDFGDTDLDEAKQMIIMVVGEKHGWASSLAGAVRLGGLIDAAFHRHGGT